MRRYAAHLRRSLMMESKNEAVSDFYRWLSFAFYKPFYDIYVATSALIVATANVLDLQLGALSENRNMARLPCSAARRPDAFFHNDEFIKWKVTVIYGAVFARRKQHKPVSDEKPLIQRMPGKELALLQQVWSKRTPRGRCFYCVRSG
ncbi:septation protein IspZ [Salmonella enterica subsp. enterica]|nr:septation protein IspZ [Salmonella enterica subsp. enterica]